MNAIRNAKAFKSGNSVALRLPKSLGIVPGTEMKVSIEDGRFVFEPVVKTRRIDLSGIYGSVPDLKPIEPGDRLFEDRKLDWDGVLLGRDPS